MHLATKHHHHEITLTQRHAKQGLSILVLYSYALVYGRYCDVLRCVRVVYCVVCCVVLCPVLCVVLRVVFCVVLCCAMMLTVLFLWFMLLCKALCDVF